MKECPYSDRSMANTLLPHYTNVVTTVGSPRANSLLPIHGQLGILSSRQWSGVDYLGDHCRLTGLLLGSALQYSWPYCTVDSTLMEVQHYQTILPHKVVTIKLYRQMR